MKAIIIFNTIVSCLVVINWLKNQNHYYFEIQKTFWKGRPYGIALMKITSGNKKEGAYSAEAVFQILLPGGKKALIND